MPEKSLTEIPRPIRDQYEKALAALQRQNFDYAVAILEQVLQREPGFYAAREALRAAQSKRAGNKGGFLKKMFGTASSSPLLAKGQLAMRSHPLETIQIAEQRSEEHTSELQSHS